MKAMTNKEYLMKNRFDELLNEIIGLCDVYDDCFRDILLNLFPWSMDRPCCECVDCTVIGCKKCIDDFLSKKCEEV